MIERELQHHIIVLHPEDAQQVINQMFPADDDVDVDDDANNDEDNQ